MDYKKIILNSLWKIIQEDNFLDSNIGERCLAHRLAFYLETDKKLNKFFVDCEYNRKDGDKAKSTPKRCNKKLMTPDIVVHKKRGDNSNNLIVQHLRTLTTKYIERKKIN